MSLDKFMELFVGRSDVFAEQQPDGSYFPVRRRIEGIGYKVRPITRQDYLDHGRGLHTYGIYTVVPAGPDTRSVPWTEAAYTKLLVFDVDTLDNTVGKLANTLAGQGVPYWMEFSGKKGYHLWVFLEDWMPAAVVRRVGAAVLQLAGVQVEVFPKQDHLSGEGFGNLVKLPLGIHRVSGEWSRGIGEHWARTQRASTGLLEALAAKFEEPPRPHAAPAGTWHGAPLVTCMERVRTQGVAEGSRDQALYALALELKRKGIPEREALAVCDDANSRFNPPLNTYVVGQKVRSAYGGPFSGVQCSREFLHDPDNPLCSSACPLQKTGPFLPATEDGPPGSAAPDVGPKLEVGQTIQVEVTGQLKREDGRTAYTLSHPAFNNTPIGVV